MNGKRRTVLQRMDALVWWSGASGLVRRSMADDGDERRHRPMRWLPLLPVASGIGLVFCAAAFPVPGTVYGIAAPVMMLATAMAVNGPLGKPSTGDDEREAALRKNAFLFCLGCLALANALGGPALLLAAAWHGWRTERLVGLAFALFMANMTWFVSLPTLYASWKLPGLADDET
jgi:hypothetical protein